MAGSLTTLSLFRAGERTPPVLDGRVICSLNVLMSVETLGEAWQLGWRVVACCDWGKRDGMKSIRECVYRGELNLTTLVWTRGLNFPLSNLATRLKSPRCGSRRVRLVYSVPKEPVTNRAVAFP